MRNITRHIVNPDNDKITITVIDPPGHGGASHVYSVDGMDFMANEAYLPIGLAPAQYGINTMTAMPIAFQCGGIADHGVNGITHEVLLAIIEDRLMSFQNGPFANEFNALALEHVTAARQILLTRTRERMARGVEGTHKK